MGGAVMRETAKIRIDKEQFIELMHQLIGFGVETNRKALTDGARIIVDMVDGSNPELLDEFIDSCYFNDDIEIKFE